MAKVSTVYYGVAFAIAIVCPTVSPAQTVDDQARAVTAGCHEAIRNAEPQTFDAGMCLGIIKGLHYLSRDVCIPPATSLAEIADIISRFADGHQGKKEDDFRETSLEAMRSAWPCSNRHSI